MNNHSQSYWTTAQQRQKLFVTWQKTGCIQTACDEAGVSRSTFYYWRTRFLEGGYGALEETRSHAPLNPRRVPQAVEDQIIKLKQQNPAWGKRRIAQTVTDKKLAQSLSPNTVRRVLVDAGLWTL